MPKTKVKTSAAVPSSSSSNSTSKSQNGKRKRKIAQALSTNNAPSSSVEEIVKRYSMQSSKSDKTEQLSEECLAEISALEETFHELDSFELQVESVKDESQINPEKGQSGPIGIGNDENQKEKNENQTASKEQPSKNSSPKGPMEKANDGIKMDRKPKIKEQNSAKKNHLELENAKEEIGAEKKPRRSSRISKP